MNEIEVAIQEIKETLKDMRDNRRNVRESLWQARKMLKDPALTTDERDFWEENIAEADETIKDLELKSKELEKPPAVQTAPASGYAEKAVGTVVTFIGIFFFLMLLLSLFR